MKVVINYFMTYNRHFMRLVALNLAILSPLNCPEKKIFSLSSDRTQIKYYKEIMFQFIF